MEGNEGSYIRVTSGLLRIVLPLHSDVLSQGWTLVQLKGLFYLDSDMGSTYPSFHLLWANKESTLLPLAPTEYISSLGIKSTGLQASLEELLETAVEFQKNMYFLPMVPGLSLNF